MLAEGVARLEDECFKGTDIVEVVIPKSTKSIGNKAFSGCKNLSSVTL